MLKTFSAAALLAIAGTAFAQTTTTPSTAPSTSPGQPPMTTQDPAPVVAPSQTPAVTPPSAVGGMGRCQNMIGADRDACMQQERAGTGSTGAGTTSSGSVSGSTSGSSTQPTAPIGSPSGTVR